MINRQTLLADLQRLLQRLEADLLERSESTEIVRVGEALRQEYEQAKAAARTAQNYEDWRSDTITQHAAAWVLSCVFVRFLEDNRLLDPPRISGQRSAVSDQLSAVSGQGIAMTAGSCSRLQLARDEQELYFRSNPRQTDRDYLLAVFDQLKALPATADVFGDHNPLRQLPDWLSGDAAGELLRFFQKINADDGLLIHDFTDPEWNTRFLGDLYQDLSEAARKKYALLQTPDFVEAFILDRTLEPALDEFGLTGKRSAVSGQQSAISDPQSAKNKKLTADSLTAESSFKLIDPACGSGHFLLGAFPRILGRWQRQEPATGIAVLVQRTLDSIHGVDVNPFAIAIARFRLLLVAMRACGVQRLADAPAFRLHLACGDSLYHGRQRYQVLDADWQDEAHYFRSEDTAELRRILREGTYHAVVANPPYITPKDAAANQAYRKLYPRTCHRQYALSVPFMERLFALAVRGTTATASTARAQGRNLFDEEESSDSPQPTSPGYVGQITANSFMKREFGKKLIEDYFPTVDLTHVIDTSGAYIPGHGTPTVILFGRNRQPLQATIRTVLGIRGEPSTPANPAEGRVWTAILQSNDHPSRAATVRERSHMETPGGGESASSRARLEDAGQFVSAGDSQRELFLKHPWSIGGGGASELKEKLETENETRTLQTFVSLIGFVAMTRADDVYFADSAALRRCRIQHENTITVVEGDTVRDWHILHPESAVFPYDVLLNPIQELSTDYTIRYLWPSRTLLWTRREPNGDHRQLGLTWYEWSRFQRERFRTPLSITFAEIATHNHFVLDRGGKVFNRTAPVIKLAADATEDQHLALLGLLNSSTACFWMKQVSHQKQMTGGDGVRIESRAKVPYAFSGTRLGEMPIPAGWTEGSLRERLLQLTREMDQRAARLSELTPKAMLARCELTAAAIRTNLEVCERERSRVRSEMILLQEEIDFTVYAMWGFVSEDLLADDWHAERVVLDAGDRPFDILRGANEDGFPVPNGVPETWPVPLRQRWEARMAAIQGSPELRLIEDPHYKRRWKGRQGLFNHSAGADDLSVALQDWLLNRLESYFDFDGRMQPGDSDQRPSAPLADVGLHSLARLASVAGSDADFHEVATVYRDDPAFDVLALVTELVQPESVPLLPVLRYKDSGLRKRSEWEQTWDLQRKEDELSNQLSSITEQIAAIDDQQAANRQELNTERDRLTAELAKLTASLTVPPKYVSADFLSGDFWRLRGKLDVPKERWISFPHCDAADGTLMLCWAGYNHLQQAQAISGHYAEIEEREGGGADPRLPPLLACLLELLPWLKQWHNDVDPTYGVAMGDYFEGFVNEEARKLGLTLQDLRNWTPPARQRRRGRRSS